MNAQAQASCEMPEQSIPVILPHPETSSLPGGAPHSPVRRTSKIARLPRKLRDLINAALDDGASYGAIVQQLSQSTNPPLPYPISERNLSDWHRAGYQDWLRHQDYLAILSTRLEDVFDLLQTTDPAQLQQTAIHLGNLRLVEYLSQLAITDPEADPKLYCQLLSILPRIARESLNLRKHLDAQSLAPAEPKTQKAPPAAASVPVPEALGNLQKVDLPESVAAPQGAQAYPDSLATSAAAPAPIPEALGNLQKVDLRESAPAKEIQGEPLNDPNRAMRAQVIGWKGDGTPDFGIPLPDKKKNTPK
jgi:hypothetical protein